MIKKSVDFRISLDESNILKGIAICAMVLHHLFFMQPQYGEYVHQLALLGKVCVSIFLFLSGYGLAVQYKKRLSSSKSKAQNVVVTLKFLAKRFVKFYLNYWVIFIGFVPLGVFVFGRSLQVAYEEEVGLAANLVKDFFCLQSYTYNATWWFNFLIVSLYLLFPLLYWFMRRKIIAVGFLLLLALWPRYFEVEAFFYLLQLWNSNLVIFTLVFCLGIGAALHGAWLNVLLNKLGVWPALCLSLLCCVALCVLRQTFAVEFIDQILMDAFITPFLALSVVCLARLTGWRFVPLTFLGKHSMNMYLTHTFIIGYFFSSFVFSFKYPILIFAVSLLLSLGLSVVIEFVKQKLGFYRLQQKLIKLMD